ncbi:TetR/AcrR family transcriptional regulator [Eubacteriaceae bacterium ES3]|nr:TetR/AcrR family transcriptional regulator [Eubacteriaceae bacterium ES3]
MNLLIDGLIDLMNERPYEKISIKDICEYSGVSRQTFYNLIETKEALLRSCIRNVFDEIIKKQTYEMDANMSILIFVQAFYENQKLVDCLIRDHQEMIFVQVFIASIRDLTALFEHKDNQTSYIYYKMAYYAGGLSQLLFWWMKDPKRVSSEVLVEILKGLDLPYFDLTE